MMIAGLQKLEKAYVRQDVPLSSCTRFGLGGPARWLVDTADEATFLRVLELAREAGVRTEVIGGGSNLVCHDAGFDGLVLRYTEDGIEVKGLSVSAGAGTVLQTLVDRTVEEGLTGIHTMTGVPGWVGGAVYGNAGAYGRSMHQNVASVRCFDGESIQVFDNQQCRFRYRSSAFKDDKRFIVFSTTLSLKPGDVAELRSESSEILAVRNAKYPPEMKCAGSIFKNLLLDELSPEVRAQVDPKVIREGKVPSAYFLDCVGAKGMAQGDIHVAAYHANLIYNAGQGTARQVRELATELKQRVFEHFGLRLEEEVQYIGF